MGADFDRFRSFAERYIVQRAPLFRAGHEKEDAWIATQDAKTIYNNIALASKDPNVCDNVVEHGPSSATQGNIAKHFSPGATGPVGPFAGGGVPGPAKPPNVFANGGPVPPGGKWQWFEKLKGG